MRRRSRRRPRARKADRAARRSRTQERFGPLRDQWLLPTISFDPYIIFNPANQGAKRAEKATTFLYEKLSTGKGWRYRKKKLTALKILCTNLMLLEPFNDTDRYRNVLKIPKDKNKYWKDIRLKHLTDIPDFIDELLKEGLIDMKLGYCDKEKNKWELTKIWPTPDFVKIIGRPLQMDNQTISYTGDLIELRDENKNAIAYRDTKETIRIREILKLANKINGQYHTKYRICRGVMASLHTDLHAIFNQKLTWGGRLFTRHGQSYQSLSEKDRATIEIAGKPTIELDYSGMHPRMLYAEMGEQFPADADPYKMVYETDDKDLRSWLKIMLLAILNASNRTKATQAASKALDESWKQCQARRRTEKGVTYFIDRFEEAHAPIKHIFYTIRGRKLMNKDSKIALRIIDHFAKQDKPILVIHDSFITSAIFKDELRATMAEAYKAETGGFTCPIH